LSLSFWYKKYRNNVFAHWESKTATVNPINPSNSPRIANNNNKLPILIIAEKPTLVDSSASNFELKMAVSGTLCNQTIIYCILNKFLP